MTMSIIYPERLSCEERKEGDGHLFLPPRARDVRVPQQLAILEPRADLQRHVVTPTRQTDVKTVRSHHITHSHNLIQYLLISMSRMSVNVCVCALVLIFSPIWFWIHNAHDGDFLPGSHPTSDTSTKRHCLTQTHNISLDFFPPMNHHKNKFKKKQTNR